MVQVPPGYPVPPSQDPGRERTPWWVYVEDALIILAIAVLWFTVARVRGPAVLAIQVVTLAVMVAIMVVRLRRLMAARREAEDKSRRL